MYFHGLEVPNSYHYAVERYIKAANQGCAAAQANIGIKFLNRLDVPQNQQLAIEWLTEAAKGGHTTAQ